LLFVAIFYRTKLFERLSKSKLIAELRGGISQIEVRSSFFLILKIFRGQEELTAHGKLMSGDDCFSAAAKKQQKN